MLKRFAIVSLIIFSISVISASAEMWKDSFDGDTINEQWVTAVSKAGARPSADWKVENGVLTGRWPTFGQQHLLIEYPSPEYTVQVRCRINEIVQQSNDNGVGIIFHSSGPGRTNASQGAIDFYGFGIGPTPGPGGAAIWYVGNGNWGSITDSGLESPVDISVWYTLKLVVKGNSFQGYVDDKLVCDAQDDRFTGNYVGPYMSLYMDASFDEFVVTDQVDDLSASAVDAHEKLSATWGHIKTGR